MIGNVKVVEKGYVDNAFYQDTNDDRQEIYVEWLLNMEKVDPEEHDTSGGE